MEYVSYQGGSNQWSSTQEVSDHWKCRWNVTKMSRVVLKIKNAILTSFIPSPILLVLQVLSYHAIKKSMQKFKLDFNRINTLKRLRKTFFTIVLIFIILTFPKEINCVIIQCLRRFFPHRLPALKLIHKLRLFFTLLHSLNTCINPFIYAKIHRKFTRIPNKVHTTFKHGLKSMEENLTLRRQQEEHTMSMQELKNTYTLHPLPGQHWKLSLLKIQQKYTKLTQDPPEIYTLTGGHLEETEV